MPSSSATEFALRAAVNLNSLDLSAPKEKVSSIAENAKELAGKIGKSVTSNLSSPEALAIEAAVAVVGVAYLGVVHVMGMRDDSRDAYDRERVSGIASFSIPEHVEERKLSKEVKVMKGILGLALGQSSFAPYFGIRSSVLATNPNETFYCVVPNYRVGEKLDKPLASTKSIDKQRTAIGLFLKSALPEAIADIDNSFKKDNSVVATFQAGIKGKNYLNDRRAPRFIMIMLGNLLWNLQHLTDIKTGFPLELSQCISICKDVEFFLNQLLDVASCYDLEKIDNEENEIVNFVRKIEIYVKTLKTAYVEEQLNEVNINEVADSAHRALRIMDQSIFKLIFSRINPETKNVESDDRVAETIATDISYLNLLLRENPQLVSPLSILPAGMGKPPFMNVPPQTTVDVLIFFSHLSWRERDNYLAHYENSSFSTEIGFAKTLRKFDRKFIKPIKAVSKKELHHAKSEEIGRLTAQRLVPLLTLVIEDFRLDVDTPLTYLRAKKSQEDPTLPKFISGKQQAVAINESAQQGDGYYQWALSPFIEGAVELDDLPKYQYRMTQVSKLIDSVGELVQNYRSFLLQKSFQEFLKDCLKRVKEETEALEKRITEADTSLEHNEHVSRTLKTVLLPMTDEFKGHLTSFSRATTNFEHVVSAPDFTDQQRQLLTTKLEGIVSQFSMLFGEDCGLTNMLDTPSPELLQQEAAKERKAPPLEQTHVRREQVIALRGLVQGCYNALSYQSKHGHKGLLLRELIDLMDRQATFSKEKIREVLMEVIRVTASARETWFFQAPYGKTRSAIAFTRLVRSPELNETLPIASILFDDPEINVMALTDEKIHHRIMVLHDANRNWQEPSANMRINYSC